MGNCIFMTGATSGLGQVSALKAAKEGATVIVLARNKEKGKSLIDKFEKIKDSGEGEIKIVEGNLSDLKSVHDACQQVAKQFPKLDMIVNNAGIMSFSRKLSHDNIEETLQVNLLAPILINHLLYKNIAKDGGGKIILTSSALHQGNINFEDIEFENSFSTFKVYRQSKLGLILLSRLLAPRLEKDEVEIYALHPGVVKSDLGREASWFMRIIFNLMGTSTEKGAETLNYLIEKPKQDLTSGEYYTKKKITKTTEESYDLEVAEQLLQVCRRYLEQYLAVPTPIFT